MKNKILIVGAAIVDVLASPVDAAVFKSGSYPAETICMSVGGDALNEATVLSKLGVPVLLETIVGDDMAGKLVQRHCENLDIKITAGRNKSGIDTGINIVLVQKDGERVFLTNPHGSLRKLTAEDIVFPFPEDAGILCFASIFVFPDIKTPELTAIFHQAKSQGMIVCADMTKPKNNETAAELAPALAYVDYIMPNQEEALLVTGDNSVEEAANSLYVAGVKNVIVKCGAKGCFVKNKEIEKWIPAEENAVCVDTTGAGDSFAAGFLYGLFRKKTLTECAVYANKCGARAIAEVGATDWAVREKNTIKLETEK